MRTGRGRAASPTSRAGIPGIPPRPPCAACEGTTSEVRSATTTAVAHRPAVATPRRSLRPNGSRAGPSPPCGKVGPAKDARFRGRSPRGSAPANRPETGEPLLRSSPHEASARDRVRLSRLRRVPRPLNADLPAVLAPVAAEVDCDETGTAIGRPSMSPQAQGDGSLHGRRDPRPWPPALPGSSVPSRRGLRRHRRSPDRPLRSHRRGNRPAPDVGMVAGNLRPSLPVRPLSDPVRGTPLVHVRGSVWAVRWKDLARLLGRPGPVRSAARPARDVPAGLLAPAGLARPLPKCEMQDAKCSAPTGA